MTSPTEGGRPGQGAPEITPPASAAITNNATSAARILEGVIVVHLDPVFSADHLTDLMGWEAALEWAHDLLHVLIDDAEGDHPPEPWVDPRKVNCVPTPLVAQALELVGVETPPVVCIPLDRGVADLVIALWRAGHVTYASSEGDDDSYGYIAFGIDDGDAISTLRDFVIDVLGVERGECWDLAVGYAGHGFPVDIMAVRFPHRDLSEVSAAARCGGLT